MQSLLKQQPATTSNRQELTISDSLQANENNFTRDRVANMFQAIGQKMLKYMKTQPQFPESTITSIENFLKTIPNEKIPYRKNNDQFEDTPYWKSTLESVQNKTWMDLQWIFAETYLNREFNILTGNHLPIGSVAMNTPQEIDPYKDQKEAALMKLPREIIEFLMKRQKLLDLIIINLICLRYINEEITSENLENLILGSISGNQADLSKWPNLNSSNVSFKQPLSDFAANDLDKVLPFLMDLQSKDCVQFGYFLDNSGLELFSDILLMDYLLNKFKQAKIILYVKPLPFMVSDVLNHDIDFTLQFLNDYSSEFVERFENYIKEKRLVIKTHYFLTIHLPFWEAPDELLKEIQENQLTFFKGEFNYIKVIGDKYWQKNTSSFNKMVDYFQANIVSLKISKAPIAIGIDEEWLKKNAPEGGDGWLQSGKWAFLQSNVQNC